MSAMNKFNRLCVFQDGGVEGKGPLHSSPGAAVAADGREG